jgi:hypothetical protein
LNFDEPLPQDAAGLVRLSEKLVEEDARLMDMKEEVEKASGLEKIIPIKEITALGNTINSVKNLGKLVVSGKVSAGGIASGLRNVADNVNETLDHLGLGTVNFK